MLYTPMVVSVLVLVLVPHLVLGQLSSAPVTPTTTNVSGRSATTLVPDLQIINDDGSNVTLATNATDGVRKTPKYLQDFMPAYIRDNGGVIIHILLFVYFCMALGIVCDVYFLASLEHISEILKLPDDIAGATFMAIGTSAPELFISLIGVFISEDDIGTGTIIGSAVFNVIFVPAACAFVVVWYCDAVPKISRFAILRDSVFYILTIITLMLALKDNEIDWIESIAMLAMFVIYLVILYYNTKLGAYINDAGSTTSETESENTPLLSTNKSSTNKTLSTAMVVTQHSNPTSTWEHELDAEKGRMRSLSTLSFTARKRLASLASIDEIEGNWIENSCFLKWTMMPILLLFKITLPKPTRFCFLITFSLSIVWISVLTYLVVWMATIIGEAIAIPQTVSGLTILAAGTSIPELISSVLVVKRAGLADMALCNAIASNIFDILVCLSLPWLFKQVLLMVDLGTLDTIATSVHIQSNGLLFTTFTLILTVFALLGALSFFRWRLGLGIAVTCSIIYVLFVILASCFEIYLN